MKNNIFITIEISEFNFGRTFWLSIINCKYRCYISITIILKYSWLIDTISAMWEYL